MTAPCRLLMVIAGAIWLSGCASVPVALRDAGDLQQKAADEQRLWSMSDEIDATLRKSGAVLDDATATAYLQSVMDDLFPEFKDHLHVRILKNVEANAFAMANGSVYINTGMLLRLRNEAELAAILGHEGVHFTHKHVVANSRTAKRFNTLASVIGLGASFIAATSMSSLTQAHEVEADRIGMARMVRSGYAPQAAGAPFRRLADELRARDVSAPTLFRSHPLLETRAASLASLATGLPDGAVRARRFVSVLAGVRTAALEQAVQGGHGTALIFLLREPEQRQRFGAAGDYYLGEGYRVRALEGDQARAMRAYEMAVAQDAGDFRAHGRLGYLHMRAGNKQQAIDYFEAYLTNLDNPADSAFVRHYLEQLTGPQAP